MKLVVVVPTYDEVDNLARLVEALLRLDLGDVRLSVLVVDDASGDGTGALAEEFARSRAGRVDVLHRPAKRGLGSAYVEGFARALAGEPDVIVQMDADFSHDPGVIGAMLEAAADADVVIGSRYAAGGAVDPTWSGFRKILSWAANRVVVPRWLGLPVSDATSGFRLWRRAALERIAPSARVRSSSYGFQVEMAFLAHQHGCRIREIPIYFRERDHGRSKMNLGVALQAAGEIIALRLRGLASAEGHPHRPMP